MVNLYTHKESNIRKTWLLMTVFFVIIIVFGWLISLYLGEPNIVLIAVAISIIMNLVAYWQSDKIALAMSGAKPLLKREDNLYLFRMIENLCISTGLPMPRVYLIESNQINAFATGRDPKHAAIAVTHGALAKLENEELEGVLAHELSHIGNRDILVSTVVVVLVGIITLIADWVLRITVFGGGRGDNDNKGNALIMVLALMAAILAPIAATLIQLAVSRKREFLADTSGALLTRYPDGLANALRKISQDESPLPHAHTATAHLFLANPFKGKQKQNWMTKLFMTHPPMEERIKALVEIHIPS